MNSKQTLTSTFSAKEKDPLPKIEQTKDEKRKPGRKPAQPEPTYPVDPVVIQNIDRPKTFVNHSYRDFSNIPPESGDLKMPTEIADMSFSQKLYTLLNQEEVQRWITWNPHGRSFRVIVPKRLEQSMLLQKYFGHNRYSSFLRQLTNYGFKHITKGIDRNSYYHESFLQGLPHLLKYMPEIRDVRRQIADPEHEPDFYEICKRYPLSDKVYVADSRTTNKVMMASTNAVEEPQFKRPRIALSGCNPPPVLLHTPPSSVAVALALSRPALHPQLQDTNAQLQLLRLLCEQEQRKALITTLLLRNDMR